MLQKKSLEIKQKTIIYISKIILFVLISSYFDTLIRVPTNKLYYTP